MKTKARSRKTKTVRHSKPITAGQVVKFSSLKVKRRSPRHAALLEGVRQLKENESYVVPIEKNDTPARSYARIWSSIKTHLDKPAAGLVRTVEQVETANGGTGWAVTLKRKARKNK